MFLYFITLNGIQQNEVLLWKIMITVIIITNIYWATLCSRPCTKHFTWLPLLILTTTLRRRYYFCSFYPGGHWGFREIKWFVQEHNLVTGCPEIWTHTAWAPSSRFLTCATDSIFLSLKTNTLLKAPPCFSFKRIQIPTLKGNLKMNK